MRSDNIELVDPDEDYITEEEDFDAEEENDLHEIQVDDDINEPDAEDIDLDAEWIAGDDEEDE
ncbi:hypothetical protein SAMN05216490_2425 [Mucilaginibacter mallensis]|uniref:Uncharacterized protein n=1 Tax=Mucilaginibacter mallensis TaxID=652787 RepID=A0A1H1XDD9_MUCMA|nr:hypothetical protein [Mucilaginibacter mallensis]SDT07314.1 hypothetical protein SAMN05216490_2425 [Mucilaginibacter mallensis]